MHLLTIGETLGVGVTLRGDPLRTAGTLRLSTAGAEATVAIGVSRLGHTATYVGCVGDDPIGGRVIRDLAGEGVNTRHIRVVPNGRTAFMLRELRTAERTVVSYYRAGSAGSEVRADDVHAAFKAGPAIDVLHITGITPGLSQEAATTVLDAVTTARSRGVTVSFDVNFRRNLPLSATLPPILQALAERADLLFVGHDELDAIHVQSDDAGAALALAHRGQPAEVVIKRGARGAIAALSDGSVAEVPAHNVITADVIGAGDSFVAGYLAARAEGQSLHERLRWGAACAARTVGTLGDWEGLPTRQELTDQHIDGVSR